MDIVEDKCQATNLAIPEEKQCFPQNVTPEIIPGNAKQTGFSQSNLKYLAEPILDIMDNVPSVVKSSANDSATDSKQLCLKS